jgi:Mg2+ and Co2+ transporter CorA
MLQALVENLPWVVGLAGLFSFLAVASWSTERRKEREALYRSEAIQKIAGIQKEMPEPVIAVLRDAVAAWKNTENSSNYSMWTAIHRYRNETLQKLAESPNSGAEAVMEFLREEERVRVRRTKDGLKLAGIICTAVGVALTVVLSVAMPPDKPPIYLIGLIPGTVGVILFGAGFVTGPKSPL